MSIKNQFARGSKIRKQEGVDIKWNSPILNTTNLKLAKVNLISMYMVTNESQKCSNVLVRIFFV